MHIGVQGYILMQVFRCVNEFAYIHFHFQNVFIRGLQKKTQMFGGKQSTCLTVRCK